MELAESVQQAFRAKFGTEPTYLVRAPGRVNLIGEHTDYNDGFVLPMAIDRAVWIALRPCADAVVRVTSLDFGTTAVIPLDHFEREAETWSEYVKGVAWALQGEGYALTGWEGVMAGDVPIGAGLSSSAAIELATARAFEAVSGWAWQGARMAQLAQKAENQWVGVNCGIMDQMISAEGRAGHALLIDCRSLALQAVPLPPGTAVVILDTQTRRGLVGSAYNERRQQCETAARLFGVVALRDVSLSEFTRRAAELDETTRRRAHHVVSENERTLQAVSAMLAGDGLRLGQLMNESHASLRDDFAVSNEALNTMVACAQAEMACLGARMTGAGFGGCAVALVQAEGVAGFVTAVSRAYQAQTTLQPMIYVCTPTNGAEVVKSNQI